MHQYTEVQADGQFTNERGYYTYLEGSERRSTVKRGQTGQSIQADGQFANEGGYSMYLEGSERRSTVKRGQTGQSSDTHFVP